MGKILLIYASTTGNTEMLADMIADHFLKYKHEVKIKSFDFDPVDVEEVLHYDAVVIGTHTWDDGELPYEVEDFYDELEEVDIKGKLFAVFGSADSFYDTYGGAVDLVAERVKSLGAVLLPKRLKVDLYPDKEDFARCQEFADMVSKALQGK